jgi:calcium/calmodulin-dependent protein kinase (CaM kinase) II
LSPQDSRSAELIALNQKLLDSIAQGDWTTYTELCDPTLTAFEPEAIGHLAEGMAFHEFYFKLAGGHSNVQNTICAPHVRLMGDVAVVAYYRLTQSLDENGKPVSKGTEETRVWQKQNGQWKHVHFHRSPSQRT